MFEYKKQPNIVNDISITRQNIFRTKRSQGDFTESSDALCERFSYPLANNTFFSPIDTTMLTDNYPPKVDCILKIEGMKRLLYIHFHYLLYF